MSVLFRAEDEPLRTRVDRWRELMSNTIVPFDIRFAVGPEELRDKARLGAIGAVKVSEMTMVPGGAARTVKGIRRADPDLCKIDVVKSGTMVVEQDGRQAKLGPGDMAFVDLSRPGRWVIPEPTHGVAVLFPRALVPFRRAELARLTGTLIPGDDGIGGLASALACRLPAHLDDDAGRDGGARLGTAVLDLLAAAFAARLDNAGAERLTADTQRRALLTRIHAFVERRLGDPGLSPAAVAAAHHISIRHLHKLFETEQATVAAWIRQRRLERCRRDLLDPANRDRPVSAIAARWGFTDSAHFSRVFRAAYDAPPGEYRRWATSR